MPRIPAEETFTLTLTVRSWRHPNREKAGRLLQTVIESGALGDPLSEVGMELTDYTIDTEATE